MLRTAIVEAKSNGKRAVARELAKLGTESLGTHSLAFEHPPQVLAVKASRSGARYRGFSLPELLAEEICLQYGWKSVDRRVVQALPTEDASSRGLDSHQRWVRRQSIPARESGDIPSAQGPLLIVDDVVTTGATLTATVDFVKGFSFSPIFCFALASTTRGS